MTVVTTVVLVLLVVNTVTCFRLVDLVMSGRAGGPPNTKLPWKLQFAAYSTLVLIMLFAALLFTVRSVPTAMVPLFALPSIVILWPFPARSSSP